MRIVLGYVPNDRGEAAFDKAVSLAGQLSRSLVIINASDRHSRVDPLLAPQSYLEDLVKRAADLGVSATAERLMETDGVTALIEASESPETELIVIGIRKRSQVGKLLLGSDAQRVLLEASCPVLAVKAA